LTNTRNKEIKDLPAYANTTASYLAKDREINRIKNMNL
jgi:hypothetical protein